ncbi:MAG TPA: thiamine pyrophosphate-dependent enzyme [Candidatus Eisenbacteria bacterium]|nr:thiamine pyrophosphate-dependent enzyme [Candidatus Eisenbacteria bacterium]
MRKPDCIKILHKKLPEDVLVVTPTGKTYMYWEATEREAQISQLNLGLCTPVGLGLALALPHRKVVVLDGDGNLLFNLASIADLAVQNPGNLVDIVFDNECYQSCDSFPSATAKGVDLEAIAKGCGIENTWTVRELKEFEQAIDRALGGDQLTFIIAKVAPGEDLVSLPRQEGRENKYRFVRYVERTENIRIINPYPRRRKKDFAPSY